MRQPDYPVPATVPAARGVLRQRQFNVQIEHRRLAPSAFMENTVEHDWWVRWDLRAQPAMEVQTLPLPSVHLVIDAHSADAHGVCTRRFSRLLEGRDWVFGVKFKPATFRPFLGYTVASLGNRSLPLSDLFGTDADQLQQQGACAPDLMTMRQAAESMLRASPEPAPSP